jgi:putative transposase
MSKTSFDTPKRGQMLTRHEHTPPHLLLDHTAYFITGAIYQKRRLLADDSLKTLVLSFTQRYFKQFNWELHHWVILDNHYHLLGKSCHGVDLPLIIKSVHSASAMDIHQATACEFPVWWNYWDYCPRNEKDYMTRLNYLFYNPFKHGYVTDLKAYRFSSFQAQLEELERAELLRQFQMYPDYKELHLDEALNDDF